MDENEKIKRLEPAARILKRGVGDHRLHPEIQEQLASLPRAERRKRAKIARKIGVKQRAILRKIVSTGAGYPIDRVIRSFAYEYTHRYFTAGTMVLPASAQHLEPFLQIGAIDGTFPYFLVRPEHDHLFDVTDFMDYSTSPDVEGEVWQMLDEWLAPGEIYNYTALGDPTELTFLQADGAPFALAGFSMIRHANELHWTVLGGEILDEGKVAELNAGDLERTLEDLQNVPPEKRGLMREMVEQGKTRPGKIVGLDGVGNSWKSLLVGTFNLTTGRHENRTLMKEWDNKWDLTSDDPDILYGLPTEIAEQSLSKHTAILDAAAVLWDIGETCFRLPAYFQFKIQAVRHIRRLEKPVETRISGAQEVTARDDKGAGRFRRVAALEIINPERHVVRSYTPPSYQVEVEGFWRRLPNPESMGKDRAGNAVKGRTWVMGHLRWRDKPRRQKQILVKSSVAAARLRAKALEDSDIAVLSRAVEAVERGDAEPQGEDGFLYVARCPIMPEEVYKIGWTSKTPQERAEELSRGTGVPMAFVIVESWQHHRARSLERAVHQALKPKQLSVRREFFSAPYSIIRSVIESELARLK